MSDLSTRSAPLIVPPRPRLLGPVHPGPVLLIGAMFLAPLFLDGFWTFNVMVGLTIGISCLGLAVLTGWSRQISLMHAGVTGAAVHLYSDFVTTRFYRDYYAAEFLPGMPYDRVGVSNAVFLQGAALAIGFTTLVYLGVGLTARRLAPLYVVALTFAVQFAIESVELRPTRLSSGPSRPGLPRPEVLGISLASDDRFYLVIAVVVVAVVFVLHRLRSSRFGRAIVLVAQEPEAACAAGISPSFYRVVPWVVAGVCAGISAVLQVPVYRNPPGFLNYLVFASIFYVAVVVLAGNASLLAVVAVAVALHLAPEALLDWQLNVYLLAGAGMAVALLFGTRGVGGLVIDLCNPRRSR